MALELAAVAGLALLIVAALGLPAAVTFVLVFAILRGARRD